MKTYKRIWHMQASHKRLMWHTYINIYLEIHRKIVSLTRHERDTTIMSIGPKWCRHRVWHDHMCHKLMHQLMMSYDIETLHCTQKWCHMTIACQKCHHRVWHHHMCHKLMPSRMLSSYDMIFGGHYIILYSQKNKLCTH